MAAVSNRLAKILNQATEGVVLFWLGGWNPPPLLHDAAHRNEVGELEAVGLEEGLGLRAQFVGEEGDAFESTLFGKFDDVIDEEGAVSLATVIGVDHDVLHDEGEAADGGGDREEEVDHADDALVIAQDENSASIGLLEDEAEAFFVGKPGRGEIGLESHEGEDQSGQGGKVLDSGWFDSETAFGGGQIWRRMGHRDKGSRKKA